MTASRATAEVFLTALRALPKEEHQAVLARITEDAEWRKDLRDLTIFVERKDEPSRPFRELLSR